MSIEGFDHAIEANAHQVEFTPDGFDNKRVEGVETGKNFPGKIITFIDLRADQGGMCGGTAKENNPVTLQFLPKNGDKINPGAALGWSAGTPNTNRIEIVGQTEVSFFLWFKIVKVLKSGNQLSFSGFRSQIFNSMADRQHGLIAEQMSNVGGRHLNLIAQMDDLPRRAGPLLQADDSGITFSEVGLECLGEFFTCLIFLARIDDHANLFTRPVINLQALDLLF